MRKLYALAAAAAPLAFCTALLGACSPAAPAGPTVERVVLITCDTLRADRLGAYGFPHPVSPNVDALAARGVVFDRAYATAPMTTPALNSIFTGRYPDELGVLSNRRQLSPTATTLTEVLARAGVETMAVVSNWVVARRGLKDAGLQQGFRRYDDRMTGRESNRQSMFERDATGTTDAALAQLAAAESERFFLWVHYQDPHGPYTPPSDCLRAMQRPLTDEADLAVGTTQRGVGEIPSYQALGDVRSPEAYRIRYDAEILYFDRELGRLLQGLEERGLMDGTLVIFTSDHGESLGERNYYFSHGQHLFGELVRVPFIVVSPENGPDLEAAPSDGYRRSDALVSHVDVMATVLAAFGLDGPPNHGTSLFAAPPADRVIGHQVRTTLGLTDARHRTFHFEEREHLYDVQADPAEATNLADRDPAARRSLIERFQAQRAAVPALKLRGVRVDQDAAQMAGLKALGYTEGDGDEDDGDDGHEH